MTIPNTLVSYRTLETLSLCTNQTFQESISYGTGPGDWFGPFEEFRQSFYWFNLINGCFDLCQVLCGLGILLKLSKPEIRDQIHPALSGQLVKRVHLGNTNIYRSQQGVISDSPIKPFERVGEVSRFSFFINSKFGRTPHRHRTQHRHRTPHRHRKLLRIGACATHCPKTYYIFYVNFSFFGHCIAQAPIQYVLVSGVPTNFWVNEKWESRNLS